MFPASTNRIRNGLAVLILVSGMFALTPGIATAAVDDTTEDLRGVCSGELPVAGPVYTERPHARYLPLPQ
ncbi:MAG: hypothetical protein ACXWZG_02995 [Microbacterium sp.]